MNRMYVCILFSIERTSWQFFSEFCSRILNIKMRSNPLNQQYSILHTCNIKISSINIKIKTGNSDCNKNPVYPKCYHYAKLLLLRYILYAYVHIHMYYYWCIYKHYKKYCVYIQEILCIHTHINFGYCTKLSRFIKSSAGFSSGWSHPSSEGYDFSDL